MSNCYVILSLRTDGALQMEFPGINGRRYVPVRRLEDIQSTLKAIAKNERFLGEKGAPTQQQMRHAEHKAFQSKCPICVAGRYLAEGGEVSRKGAKLKLSDLEGLVP